MAVKHRDYEIYGLQFHPESVLTPMGSAILQNFYSFEGVSNMIQESIYRLVNRENLSLETTKSVMNEIMEGRATNAQIASFLTAMRMKGESIEEITACAMVMREHCAKLAHDGDVLEIVGTGGDEALPFNISTVSAFVISGGHPRGKTRKQERFQQMRSADVLEALGIPDRYSRAAHAEILNEIGMCFLFAPVYHASMKYAAPVRRELGVRTIFNILGPLANPAAANLQLLGVYDETLVEPLARVLANLGVKRAMVVHGHDGLDEVTLCVLRRSVRSAAESSTVFFSRS